jgi:hypothetical protein
MQRTHLQYRPPSTWTSFFKSYVFAGLVGTIFIAEVIRCAMTQPAMRSRGPEGEGMRKIYALEHLRVSGKSSGDDSARLMVSSRLVSYTQEMSMDVETHLT